MCSHQTNNYQSINTDMIDTNTNHELLNDDSSESDDSNYSYFDKEHTEGIIKQSKIAYPWKKFIPSFKYPYHVLSWLIKGSSEKSKLSDEEIQTNLIKLARLLCLLREYRDTFGMPKRGGPKEQLWVLCELCKRLYGSGTPLWVLKPVLIKAAEGMTGSRGADMILFTRSAIAYLPDSSITATFSMDRGFNMQMMTYSERVLVRLASFCSNTKAVHSVQSRSPKVAELIRAARGDSVTLKQKSHDRRQTLAKEILDLSSEGIGLFYLTNKHPDEYGNITSNILGDTDGCSDDVVSEQNKNEIDDFWTAEDSICELFTRLAVIEAIASLDALNRIPGLYSKPILVLFRALSSLGAAGLWFKASWQDMIISGSLAILVTVTEVSSLWKNERAIFEVVVSFIVGFLTGLVTLSYPGVTCFGAIAMSSVIDIFQGFRIVYAIMEIMSKHTISGGADFLEALLFTGLIAYFLQFGLQMSIRIFGPPSDDQFNQCNDPINEYWQFLLVPLTSLSWAILFKPRYKDLPVMTFHGILSYVVYWVMHLLTKDPGLATFVAAMCVTASAGFLSRFIGRQALGDTITGLYVLLPGSYLAKGLFAAATNKTFDSGLLLNLIIIAVTIAIGGWTGTMLCSPTILGTNHGLLSRFTMLRNGEKKSPGSFEKGHVSPGNKAMLFL